MVSRQPLDDWISSRTAVITRGREDGGQLLTIFVQVHLLWSLSSYL